MTAPIQTCDDCGLPIPVCNMNAAIRRCVEACGPDALKASPEVQAMVAEAVARAKKAAQVYCWQRYQNRPPLNLSSPAVFTSHEWQKIGDAIDVAIRAGKGE